MKTILALIFAGTLIACADSPTTTTSSDTAVPAYSYSRYATGTTDLTPPNSPYRKWTTAALQQRRVELYRTVPRHESPRGVPVYHYRGEPLPQQDQIYAIEAELNRRFRAGDKAASLDRPIPGMQHPR